MAGDVPAFLLRGWGAGFGKRGYMGKAFAAGNVFVLLLAATALFRVPPVFSTQSGVPVLGCRILAVHPHDPASFTQGLVFRAAFFFESTGRYGQ